MRAKKGFKKTLPSLERPIHVVAERELITKNCEWKKKTSNKSNAEWCTVEQKTRKKLQIYKSIVKSIVTYGTETW